MSMTEQQGATGVITHRVKEGQREGYERWLDEIGPISRKSPGHLDWTIIRPVAGLTGTYTVILRFDNKENLERWLGSPERKRLIEKVRPLLANDDDFFIRTGLDFWFAPDGANARVPVRWKQFLLTWSAIYGLALFVPGLVLPVLRALGVPQFRPLDVFITSGVLVALMVFIVMPHYTKLVQRWLFK